jgi:hypothetical protein
MRAKKVCVRIIAVVIVNNRNLLPSVNAWSTGGAVTVHGTLIPSGSWVRLQ